MPSTSEYLQQLQTDKQTLVDNLVTKGVSATSDETFTSLVPKVLDIQSGGSDLVIDDASRLFWGGSRLNALNELLNACKNITSCNNMFRECSSLTDLDLSSVDISKATDLSFMFYQCSNLQNLTLPNSNAESATNISNMFHSCKRLIEIDMSKFNSANITDMSGLCNGCTHLKKINLSNFNTDKLTNSSTMFGSCSALQTVIINSQNVFKMTNTNMFSSSGVAYGRGFVYVPDDMVETYKSATNWSDYADQIKGISELPEEA